MYRCLYCKIALRKESSKYILIRENSLEWNEPRIVMKNGTCCGIDPCTYDIQDNVKVLYFDDPIFERKPVRIYYRED
jgi:hypothetical protein